MTTRARRFSGSVSERKRVTFCAAGGAVALAISAWFGPWQLAILIGWLTNAVTLLGWIWAEITGLDADATRRVSTREDDSRAAAGSVIVGASLIGLVAVMIGLHRATSAGRDLEIALTAGSLATVVASWLTVHTLYTLRYAHLYYGVDEVGGVDFPGDAEPSYSDFAYLAFTVGMTFQVSDTDVTGPLIRRVLLRHALLSYLFGTAIIASTISVVSGFVA